MEKPYWTQHTHLFSDDEYECSACNALYDRPYNVCPDCKTRIVKIKYDPSWITEMADYDEICGFDDD